MCLSHLHRTVGGWAWLARCHGCPLPQSGMSPLYGIPDPCQHPCFLLSPCPAVPIPALTAPLGYSGQCGHGDTSLNVPPPSPPMSLPSAHPQHSFTPRRPLHAHRWCVCMLGCARAHMFVCAHSLCLHASLHKLLDAFRRAHTREQTCRHALVRLHTPPEAQTCSCMHTQMHAHCSTQGHTNAHVCAHTCKCIRTSACVHPHFQLRTCVHVGVPVRVHTRVRAHAHTSVQRTARGRQRLFKGAAAPGVIVGTPCRVAGHKVRIAPRRRGGLRADGGRSQPRRNRAGQSSS